ncbi:S8 family serine peptidase, partial [Phormidium sp. CCY1219]|uniref:S8 family serine peptidase n=1 Tax=Phormidium sp. CCY1219 TaxID=2886104 RepID=UPI002D1EF83E
DTNYRLSTSGQIVDTAGNTMSSARYITLGQTIAERVSSSDQYDYYRFSVNGPTRVNLSISGMSADADLFLLSSSGSTVASSTNGSNNTDSVAVNVNTGTYYIRVKRYSGDTSYTLRTSGQSLNRIPVVSGSNQTWNIGYYIYPTFNVSDPDGDAIVRYRFQDLNSAYNSGYFVLWQNGRWVRQPSTFEITASQRSYLRFVSGSVPGDNRISVQAYDGRAWSNPAYMTMTADTAGNSINNARNLTLGQSLTEYVSQYDGDDYYRFTVNTRSRVNLSISGMSADADLRLLNANGSTIASSVNGGNNSDSVSQYLDPGTYYVRVNRFAGSTGYNLNTSVQAVSTGPSFTAFSAVDASGDGTSNTVFQRGALRLNWATNVTPTSVRVFARNQATGAVTELSILNRDGVRLANLNNQNLSAGNYSIYAEARDASGNVGRSSNVQMRVLAFNPNNANSLKIGDFRNGSHTFSGMTQGSVFIGAGGTDTLNLSGIRSSDVTFNANNRAVFGGTTFDWLRVNSTGQEIYFQGYERVQFSNGTVNLGVTPNDPLFSQQWNLRMMDVPGAWRFTTGSSNVLLGIADTGLNLNSYNRPTHSDLNSGRSIIDSSDQDALAGRRGWGHGTAVQSVAAADTNDGYGMAGINWSSPVYVSNVFGSRSFNAAAQEQIEYARARGQRLVYNLSAEYISNYYNAALANLMQQNADTALFVIASGNSQNRPTNVVSWPANFAGQYGNVMAVGAVGDSNGNSATRHPYSQYGSELTAVAPSGILTANINGRHENTWGTSFASPSMAGAASLVWSVNTGLSAGDVRNILTSTANRVWRTWGGSNTGNQYGAGLVDAEAAVRRADALNRNRTVANLFNHGGLFFS